jgi:hypothetical protein
MLLIEEALAQDLGGAVKIDLPPSGVVCIIKALLLQEQLTEPSTKTELVRS